MPRKSRIDAPGALHHVIARGIGRQLAMCAAIRRGDKIIREKEPKLANLEYDIRPGYTIMIPDR